MDILSTYLALGAGLVTFWWGLFRNWSLDDCLIRTLLAMAVVFLVGQIARFLMAVALFLGGKTGPGGTGPRRTREEGAEEGEGG